MADSLNTRIADRLTRRRLQVGRVETTLRRQAWAVLALLERDIASAIAADDPTAFAILSRRRRAVEILMGATIAPLIASRYAQLATQTTEALVHIAQQEVAAVQTVVNAETDAPTLTDLPSARLVQRAVTETLIPTATSPTDQAATGDAWWQRQGESLQHRLHGQLLVGVTREEALSAVVARVRGTSTNGFRDGLMERARQDAARLLTTQVTNAVSEAHVAVADANGAATVLIHQSIFDSHTCLAAHTRIKTPLGPLPLGAATVGDIVFGGSGHPRRVLATHARQERRLVRLTLSDGTVIRCTPDHQFLTQDFGWIDAYKLKENTVLRRESML